MQERTKKTKNIAPAIKVLPHDLDAEEAVLCAMIVYGKAKTVKSILSPEDFYREAHTHIVQACFECPEPDILTVAAWLKKHDLLEKAGGLDYLVCLTEAISTGAAVEAHCKIIKDLSIRRQIILQCGVISESCFQLHEESEDIISTSREFFREIGKLDIEDLPSTARLCNRIYDNLYEQTEDPGLKVGIPTLEEFYLEPGYIHCVAGESGFGKSAFLLQVADFVARTYGTTLYFSLESTDVKLGTRLLARHAMIQLTRLNKRHIQGDWEWQKITQALSDMQSQPLILIENSRLSEVEKLVSYCEKVSTNKDIKMIVIDFLQLMSSRKKHNSRHLEISYIVNQFKQLAKQLNIPLLYASQLVKKIGGRPKLEDLKESGDIRTHTDNILFLYTQDSAPAVYTVECFLAKGKEQERFSLWLEFNGHYQEFKEGLEPEKTTVLKKAWKERI